MRKLFLNTICIFVFFLFTNEFAFSQWSNDPEVNNLIIAPNNNWIADFPTHKNNIVSDKKGGGIIAWTYSIAGNSFDFYAQRIDNLGTLKWDSAGVDVCQVAGAIRHV